MTNSFGHYLNISIDLIFEQNQVVVVIGERQGMVLLEVEDGDIFRHSSILFVVSINFFN